MSEREGLHDEIEEYLKWLRYQGQTYVKANDLTDEFDVGKETTGRALGFLAKEGKLERFNPGSSPGVWRIPEDMEADPDA